MNAYKMHEARMWTVQVIIPATLAIGYICLCTDIPEKIASKINSKKKRKKAR